MFSKLVLIIQNNYVNYTMIIFLAPNKGKTKKEMLSEYQLRLDDLYNIPMGNIKKLKLNFFDKEKYVLHYENLQLYLRLG